jgi:hypothetical protein
MMVGSNLKDQQLQQIVDKTIMEADLDRDGKISFEEFTKMVENTDVSMSMTLGEFPHHLYSGVAFVFVRVMDGTGLIMRREWISRGVSFVCLLTCHRSILDSAFPGACHTYIVCFHV